MAASVVIGKGLLSLQRGGPHRAAPSGPHSSLAKGYSPSSEAAPTVRLPPAPTRHWRRVAFPPARRPPLCGSLRPRHGLLRSWQQGPRPLQETPTEPHVHGVAVSLHPSNAKAETSAGGHTWAPGRRSPQHSEASKCGLRSVPKSY